jgi:RHS repeat-associated protein
VWKKLNFAAVTTSKIRVTVSAAVDGVARLAEVEAWGNTNAANLQWLVTDQLGTPRMIFDKTGSLAATKRHDYLPFGEEIFAGTGGRSTGYGAADSVRQKFTGYEHDDETGLEFAHARYYGSSQGRFTSTDPFLGSGRTGSPQSWNRYAYVLNNPLRLVDPTGMGDQDPQPPPPPPPAPVIPPISSDLPGSPLYQKQMDLAPRPTVTVTQTKIEAAGDLKLPNGEGYVTGTVAVLNITVTDEAGQPMPGLFITESNKTTDNIRRSKTVESTTGATTNANGAITDYVSALDNITPAPINDVPKMRGIVGAQRNTDVSVTTTQTLTIAAPGYGHLGTAVYDRTFTNMQGGTRLPAPAIGSTGRTQNNFSVTLTSVKMSYASQ